MRPTETSRNPAQSASHRTLGSGSAVDRRLAHRRIGASPGNPLGFGTRRSPGRDFPGEPGHRRPRDPANRSARRVWSRGTHAGLWRSPRSFSDCRLRAPGKSDRGWANSAQPAVHPSGAVFRGAHPASHSTRVHRSPTGAGRRPGRPRRPRDPYRKPPLRDRLGRARQRKRGPQPAHGSFEPQSRQQQDLAMGSWRQLRTRLEFASGASRLAEAVGPSGAANSLGYGEFRT